MKPVAQNFDVSMHSFYLLKEWSSSSSSRMPRAWIQPTRVERERERDKKMEIVNPMNLILELNVRIIFHSTFSNLEKGKNRIRNHQSSSSSSNIIVQRVRERREKERKKFFRYSCRQEKRRERDKMIRNFGPQSFSVAWDSNEQEFRLRFPPSVCSSNATFSYKNSHHHHVSSEMRMRWKISRLYIRLKIKKIKLYRKNNFPFIY